MQRRLVLGLDLQGGSHILLEFDSAAVRKEKLEALRDDVRRTLREARVGYNNLSIQGMNVQVRIREPSEIPEGLRRLRELSAPTGGLLAVSGQRDIEVTHHLKQTVRNLRVQAQNVMSANTQMLPADFSREAAALTDQWLNTPSGSSLTPDDGQAAKRLALSLLR